MLVTHSFTHVEITLKWNHLIILMTGLGRCTLWRCTVKLAPIIIIPGNLNSPSIGLRQSLLVNAAILCAYYFYHFHCCHLMNDVKLNQKFSPKELSSLVKNANFLKYIW